jgi:hypothetical protein
MLRFAILLALIFPAHAFAQAAGGLHMVGHHDMDGQHAILSRQHPAASVPAEPGQAAFAAIQEIVGILEADPETDWSKVNIEALRQHLIDMDNVTLRAEVKSETIEGGMRFVVSGVGSVKDSIQRTVTAHATTMSGVGNWTFKAERTDDGASLMVLAPTKDQAKLYGLGFIGVMTRGMHHQTHHLMIARDGHPHQ